MRVPTKRPAPVPARGGEKAADLIRQMLAVSIEQDDAFDLFARQPVAQTGLNRFPFPDIHRMDDDFCAAFARAGRGRVVRAVVDHKDVIELRESPLGHPADMRFLVIGRDDCSDIATIKRPAWLRGRGSIVNGRPDENPPRDRSCGRADRRRREQTLFGARCHRKDRTLPG